MVATEFRMYVKDAALEIQQAIAALARATAGQAEKNMGVPMPGTTHMQHAQPLLLSHWLLAHGEAFLRDAERLKAAAARADLCPPHGIGSACRLRVSTRPQSTGA